ncbi:STAS domain-containing protein [Umezawaea sp.]|uniref:STAS domain-containing protein n=1 Tax=Umezawaea sp. TaxID=1955258 RepID=UPI002ED42E45
MNELSWTVERHDEHVVVAPVGAVALTTAGEFEAVLLTLAVETDVVLDVSGLTFVDSSGLSIFVAAYKAGLKHGKSVVLDPVPPFLERVLKVTGLGTLLLARHQVR